MQIDARKKTNHNSICTFIYWWCHGCFWMFNFISVHQLCIERKRGRWGSGTLSANLQIIPVFVAAGKCCFTHTSVVHYVEIWQLQTFLSQDQSSEEQTPCFCLQHNTWVDDFLKIDILILPLSLFLALTLAFFFTFRDNNMLFLFFTQAGVLGVELFHEFKHPIGPDRPPVIQRWADAAQCFWAWTALWPQVGISTYKVS